MLRSRYNRTTTAAMQVCAIAAIAALTLFLSAGQAEQPVEAEVGSVAAAEQTPHAFFADRDLATVTRDRSGKARRIFGPMLATGRTPAESASAFVRDAAAVYAVDANDLFAANVAKRQTNEIPLCFDPGTGNYRFIAMQFAQQRDGLAVYESRFVVVVRNVPGFPVVLANGQLRDLGALRVDPVARQAGLSVAARTAVLNHVGQLSELRQGNARILESRKVLFAGIDDVHIPPRIADDVVVAHGPEKWRIVVDSTTGAMLDHQPMTCKADLIVVANCMTTEGIGADICEAEVVKPLPYLGIQFDNTVYYTSKFGNITIPGQAQQAMTVVTGLSGKWFDVVNAAGPSTVMMQTLAPPGPAIFTFNDANTDEFLRAEVNTYIHANRVRDFVLQYNPIYPTLGGEGFPINVNRDDLFCPGNAWYDLIEASLNFCIAGVNDNEQPFPNMAWSSIVYHEFGHHLVEVAGSGQGQYGEGFGDALSTIMLDTPLLGFGYFNNCTDSLRNAEAGVTVPCDSSIHHCGQALSGCIWDTRNELINTKPDDYQDILADLLINSVLIHTGSTIEQDLVVDFLTLDDDNGNIFDGTPNFDAITTGFVGHGMIIPQLQPIAIDFPDGMPQLASPDGNTLFNIEIRQLSGALEPGQLSATFIVDGQSINALPQAAGRGNLYTFQIPQATCGDRIQYSITAQATDGTTVASPFNAPAQLHEVVSGFDAAVLMTDDFEQDLGWVSEPLDATGGWWERGVPISDFLWIYGPPADSDGSGQCWLTGNHLGNSDVDDGSVRLSSPTYQVSADTSIVEYDYYLRLSNENGNDRLVVQATDGLNAWVEIARHDNDGGVAWHNHRVTPQDLAAAGVTNTGTLQIRFTVSDLTPQSIVEAGVDNLRISQLDCQADVIGDLNDDQRVDIFDLLIMVDAWGPCLVSCPPSCLADIEPNCAVDVFDLLLLLEMWSDDVTPEP